MEKLASSYAEHDRLIILGNSFELCQEVSNEHSLTDSAETQVLDSDALDSLFVMNGISIENRRVFVAIGPEQLNFRRSAATLQARARKGILQQIVSDSAQMGKNITLGENVFVGSCARIGTAVQILENTFINSCAVIGAKAQIGKNVWIGPHATIESGAIIGDHCVIGPGVTIAKSRIGKFCEITVAGRYTRDFPDQTFIIEGYSQPIFSYGPNKKGL